MTELNEILNGQTPRSIGGVENESSNHSVKAAEEVEVLGQNPSLSQTTTLLMTQFKKMEEEMKNSNKALAHHLMETIANVKQQGEEIMKIKEDLTAKATAIKKVEESQASSRNKVKSLEEKTERNFDLISSNRQRETKGNFIVSGDHIPTYTQNENLFNIMSQAVWHKYGTFIQWEELQSLHRLPGNKIFFSLFSRMPGTTFEKLISHMNSNPNPNVRIYISIQLLEPFNQIFYLARKLKQNRVISNYRLDENGVTHVALSQEHKTFRLHGVEQLQRMKINLPPDLLRELEMRKKTENAWEEAKIARNEKTAFELRQQRSEASTNDRKRPGSSTQFTPPQTKKAPAMRGSPPTSQLSSNNGSTFPAVSQPRGQPTGPAQPTVTGGTATQPHSYAAQQQPPSTAAAGQPGAGYYHSHYHNGVPVNGYGAQTNSFGQQSGTWW